MREVGAFSVITQHRYNSIYLRIPPYGSWVHARRCLCRRWVVGGRRSRSCVVHSAWRMYPVPTRR